MSYISGTLSGDQIAPADLVCDQNTGQCACLTGRIGRTCDSCNLGKESDPCLVCIHYQ